MLLRAPPPWVRRAGRPPGRQPLPTSTHQPRGRHCGGQAGRGPSPIAAARAAEASEQWGVTVCGRAAAGNCRAGQRRRAAAADSGSARGGGGVSAEVGVARPVRGAAHGTHSVGSAISLQLQTSVEYRYRGLSLPSFRVELHSSIHLPGSNHCSGIFSESFFPSLNLFPRYDTHSHT